MKKLSILLVLALTGCVGYYPSPAGYYQPAPVYVAPRPVYVAPPVYIAPQPHCYYVARWNNYYRTYQNVRVCR